MLESKYLIVGSSHAGLSAAEEIRVNDPGGSLALVTQEDVLPYSPTALPYVVSGRAAPEGIGLRDEAYFREWGMHFLRSRSLTHLDLQARTAVFAGGPPIRYEKLLLATGAEPTCPGVENLAELPYLELRTMADALRHRDVLRTAKSAVVLGTGLVGIHAAETFAQRGLAVEVARARPKRNPRILPGAFDEASATMIQRVFEGHGVRFRLGAHAVRADHRNGAFAVTLNDGEELRADLLLVCTGIRPRMAFLEGSGVETGDGILVDRKMRTSAPGVWAAGDVAQADDFFRPGKALNAILPDAVLQGKIAGADMSGGRLDGDYDGGISRNTFAFFGNRAFSVGLAAAGEESGFTVNEVKLPAAGMYQRMVFDGRVLVGMSAINSNVDPGVVYQLIRRRVDAGDDLAELAENPASMGRRLMWKIWR